MLEKKISHLGSALNITFSMSLNSFIFRPFHDNGTLIPLIWVKFILRFNFSSVGRPHTVFSPPYLHTQHASSDYNDFDFSLTHSEEKKFPFFCSSFRLKRLWFGITFEKSWSSRYCVCELQLNLTAEKNSLGIQRKSIKTVRGPHRRTQHFCSGGEETTSTKSRKISKIFHFLRNQQHAHTFANPLSLSLLSYYHPSHHCLVKTGTGYSLLYISIFPHPQQEKSSREK